MLGTDSSLDFIDDESFTKTELYHWMIKTCHEICTSIELSVKFIRIFAASQLPVLREKAHPYEKEGIEYWAGRLTEETTELDVLQTELHAIREQVRELVSIFFSILGAICTLARPTVPSYSIGIKVTRLLTISERCSKFCLPRL